MIKYNLNNINDWYFNSSDIIKVYRNGAVVFYKFDSEQGGYKVCFAVVDDITKYTDREFEDVYDKETEKWYKLNNLNQYEEYGIYASGRTSCEGSTSRLPVGYTEVEYVQNTGSSTINTNFYPNTNTRVLCEMEMITTQSYPKLFGAGTWNVNNSLYIEFATSLSVHWIGSTSTYSDYPKSFAFAKHKYDLDKGNLYINDTLVGTKTYSSVVSVSSPLGIFSYINNSTAGNVDEHFLGKLYTFKIYDDGTLIRDFVPAKRDSDNVAGLYDIVNDVFYTPMETNIPLVAGDPVTPTDCVTTYKGKLTIDDGYEYEWNGSSWVNLGEVSGSSITIKSPEYIEKDSSNGGRINLDYVWKTNSKMQFKFYSTNNGGGAMIGEDGTPDNNDCRMFFASTTAYFDWGSSRIYWSSNGQKNTLYEYEYGNYYIKNMVTSTSMTGSTISTSRTNPLYLGLGGSDRFRTYYLKFYDGDTLVKDFIPWTDMNGNYGLFDKVSLSVYNVVSGYGNLTGSSNVTDVEVGGGYEYPVYYDEKSAPLDNLTFNTLEDAEAYAYNNCVYDGMKATINGSKYYFDSDEGWVYIPEYYKFEDVTPGGASGWTISGSSTYNPDSSYYDDFDLETTSTSYSYKIAKVTIFGYDHFTYYLRTSGYSTYCYAVATNVDEIQTPPSTMSYNSSSAITNTYNWNKSPKSAVNLSNYRRVTYNNLDKTVEHTFYVYFYGRTYSSYVGNATILIPKEQTNENWEQVTFSASSNVASAQKNLYIDGNAATSGGTTYFYYRWMIGLPVGSHTSYTNYSAYDYCPNVTSSTFTSVTGEQRQVNFTYNDATNKTLSFRLVDESGNTLTPTNTVYYNMTGYNSCNVSSGITNLTFPRTQSVKVGGSFKFGSSSNRDYIYGYTTTVGTSTYYVDNYSSTFDIIYRKLDEEAVTITYTTYDPNDTETPTFSTEITWPYSGGSTVTTAATSYNIPYTYSYTVEQTSDLFSASTQSYTANQASRTISFTLYPNNREFASVSDLEAYQYAYEGMIAFVNGTKYQYKNGEWVEQTYNEYEYIRSANLATSHYTINTNFYPTTANTIEVKFEMVDRSIDWGDIICWKYGSSWGDSAFRFQTVTSGYQAIVRTGNNNGVNYRPTIGANKVVVYTLPLSAQSGTYSVDGGTSQTITYNYSTMVLPSQTAMHLFSNGGSGDGKAAVGKMYYVKVYDGSGNLVKHYVPSDYNGTPCFYEKIDGDYIMDTYTGSNHGTLTLGPQV